MWNGSATGTVPADRRIELNTPTLASFNSSSSTSPTRCPRRQSTRRLSHRPCPPDHPDSPARAARSRSSRSSAAESLPSMSLSPPRRPGEVSSSPNSRRVSWGDGGAPLCTEEAAAAPGSAPPSELRAAPPGMSRAAKGSGGRNAGTRAWAGRFRAPRRTPYGAGGPSAPWAPAEARRVRNATASACRAERVLSTRS